ncbi:MAG TPA: YihY/virulence factor BrkB family protein [Steroidobacteraceae bacterium]|nr:YihY/virulence factor BrkB family protein [Steroidobacteraceae bacterium]
MSNGAEADRGRSAQEPRAIPRTGWRDILLRVLKRIGRDNLPLVSAGIAFNAMFATFPALVVLLSIYGLFSSSADVAREMRPFFGVLPADAARIIQAQLSSIASRTSTALGIGAAVSMAVTVWSSVQGMAALTTAMNVAYHQRERRGYFELLGVALIFTLGALAGLIVLLALGIALPLVVTALPLGPLAKTLALALRWVLLWSFAAGALAVVYRYAPCREDPQWRWVTWGSVLSASLWLGVSLLFTVYVENFGSYARTYGALGGVMILLTWFYLGSFSVVLGAELNAEMEHQTAVDTTTGPPQPMGERGAYVADTLGPIPGRRRNENRRSANPSSGR